MIVLAHHVVLSAKSAGIEMQQFLELGVSIKFAARKCSQLATKHWKLIMRAMRPDIDLEIEVKSTSKRMKINVHFVWKNRSLITSIWGKNSRHVWSK